MIHTEKAVLAVVIFKNSLAPILLANADKTLFSYAHNRIIFEQIRKLHEEEQFFDPAIMADRLKGRVPLSYISSVMECLIHSNIKFLKNDLNKYLNILKQEKAKREILKEINRQAKEPNCDLKEIQNIISKTNLLNIETETGDIEDCFTEFDQMSERNGEISLGLPGLDKAIGGFRLGEVLLFMARTTVGKSFWALNVLYHLISHTQEKITFFSLEMPGISVLERLTQITFSLPREEAQEKLKTDKKIREQLKNEFKNLKIYTQNYSVGDIEIKIREDGSKIIFIDYLDLLRELSLKNQNRYERISDHIIELKRIAKRQDCLLIVSHQLQRQAEEGGVAVKLTMARDSGVIEEASDIILGAWRPELRYDVIALAPETERNRLIIRLLKNKRGPAKMISCFFDHSKTGKIWEIEWRDE